MLNPYDVSKRLGLTVREAEVVQAVILNGGEYLPAARALGIGRETVKSHLLTVRLKLGLSTSTQLILVYDRVARGKSNSEAMEGMTTPMRMAA